MTNDEQLMDLELKISRFLRRGVFSSAVLITFGWLILIIKNDTNFLHLKTYQQISFLDSIKLSLATGAYENIVIYTGLIILISLPIIRVLLTAILFWKQNDKLLSYIAIFVLFILMLSFSLGFEL